ncbi:hypothetical protein F511_39216 [Dorcoceras hygrometricum]|uniref:MULE transposase domain-containing protein n=1 Tax=Dorcoceras hygrometricum TaxID=472368 RepID=A0A2Z7BBX4_9LAMI|nr:hypothetical protein F511_39216 [Dorcoceras hygrometricum]
MIFAPFVGVNHHHHQIIVFGCGFLSNEKTESFVWLFSKFIEAMPKGAPNVIITDQDPAITKAIAHAFPQIVHRYCLWHILNKFSDKIDPLTFPEHYRKIKDVIANSSTPEQFEKSWEEVIENNATAEFKGNVAAKFYDTMQLLISKKGTQLLVLTEKDAPADEQCICWKDTCNIKTMIALPAVAY